jgi:hypothetical protein
MNAGDRCTLSSLGDLYVEDEARPFIGAECIFVKVTKAGLAQVALAADPRKTYSAPPRNLEPL